ncbi:hypothetical protein V5O48_013897 [Marasmius crinis-equi]|uniref:Glucose-methanol-choline oxidoreductase N-terminal domain-containing protein n=1 Tax=Marasmius crinis-equi TaxID=585013 RepID=A0ABR3EZ64_9AGAR
MGIAVAGSSLGALAFPIMLNNLIHGHLGFANGVRASAGLVGGSFLIGVLLMRTRLPPKSKGGLSLLAAAKKFSKDIVYLFAVLAVVFFVQGVFFSVFYIQLLSDTLGLNPVFGFYSVSILSFSSLVGRVLAGAAANTFGVFNVTIFCTLSGTGVMFSLFGVKNLAGVTIFAILYGFFSGACPADISLLGPVFASLAGDVSEVGFRIGIAYLFAGLGSLIGTPITGALLSRQFIWWRPIVYNSIMCVAGTTCFFICRSIIVSRKGTLVYGRLFTDPKGLQSEYDFVIVGAGTAGNVIAARLSENPEFRVCVIEAGGNDEGNTAILIPFTAPGNIKNASLIWNFTTVPQKGLDDRVLSLERGRVLGGSSSLRESCSTISVSSLIDFVSDLDFMTWTRGSRDDFNRIADVTGDPGWSWNALLPYILKAENFTAPADHHNTSGEFDPRFHGHNGPLLITLPGFPSDVDPRILGITESDPSHFPYNLDMNDGDPLGIGWVQSNTGLGQRSSSATAYLHPALNRPNLDVLIGWQVTRLIANGRDQDGRPDLRSVELAESSAGPRSVIHASKEVVLAAGAINTPQILLLSGVGEKEKLTALGLEHHVHSAGVGKNFQDHPLLGVQWFANSTTTLDNLIRNVTLVDQLIEQWSENRTGPLVDVGSNLIGWSRLPHDSPILKRYGDPSAGVTAAHIELYPFNGFFSFATPAPTEDFFFSMVTIIASPASRGTVTLASSDPFHFPAIDPAYLTHPQDVAIAVEGIRLAQRFTSQPSWSQYLLGLFGPSEISSADDPLIEYARKEITTLWHPCCTAKMGNKTDKNAVVDAHLMLKGAAGVRIVDASVFPYIPAAHLQAPIYAIAERASDLIKFSWKVGHH